MNTIKRHQEQIYDALSFTAQAKFTNAENLQLAAQRTRRGFPTQLKNLGYILSREMPGGNQIFGLSKVGAESVCGKQFDIHKVSIGRVEHAIIGQYETLLAMHEGRILGYEFEPQNFYHDTRPDVLWNMADQSLCYVEVELSGKSTGDGDLDKFFIKLLSRKTVVYFKDPILLGRYVKAARQYMKDGIPNWKLLGGKWVKLDEQIKYDRTNWDLVEFKLHKSQLFNKKLSFFFDAVRFGF